MITRVFCKPTMQRILVSYNILECIILYFCKPPSSSFSGLYLFFSTFYAFVLLSSLQYAQGDIILCTCVCVVTQLKYFTSGIIYLTAVAIIYSAISKLLSKRCLHHSVLEQERLCHLASFNCNYYEPQKGETLTEIVYTKLYN